MLCLSARLIGQLQHPYFASGSRRSFVAVQELRLAWRSWRGGESRERSLVALPSAIPGKRGVVASITSALKSTTVGGGGGAGVCVLESRISKTETQAAASCLSICRSSIACSGSRGCFRMFSSRAWSSNSQGTQATCSFHALPPTRLGCIALIKARGKQPQKNPTFQFSRKLVSSWAIARKIPTKNRRDQIHRDLKVGFCEQFIGI